MVGPVCLNTTDIIGITVNALTVNVTGSVFLSLLMIFILLMVICMGAGIPLEWTAVLILPLSIYLLACSADFLQIGGFVTIYAMFMLAKMFFFNR